MNETFDFTFSEDNSIESLFDNDHARAISNSNRTVIDNDVLVTHLTQSDETRLHILLSARARHLGSFVLGPFGGYTIDCGLNWLPKYWTPDLDPPILNGKFGHCGLAYAFSH